MNRPSPTAPAGNSRTAAPDPRLTGVRIKAFVKEEPGEDGVDAGYSTKRVYFRVFVSRDGAPSPDQEFRLLAFVSEDERDDGFAIAWVRGGGVPRRAQERFSHVAGSVLLDAVVQRCDAIRDRFASETELRDALRAHVERKLNNACARGEHPLTSGWKVKLPPE